MIIPEKKLHSGFKMPVFGVGTWTMGGKFERDKSSNDKADIAAIKEAVKMGVTHIDTAEMYAGGHAEEMVGEAIKGFERKKLFLVSKVSPSNLTYEGILKSAKRSLEHLNTDYLDLYLIHMPNPSIPIKESMKAMDHLLEQGMIRNIGLSNFSVERFEQAQSHTKNKIVANQLHYNLIFREAEAKGLVEYCRDNDVMLIAWRPVQKGLLTGSDIDILNEMARKYEKTAAQIAINWLVSQPNVVTLSKTSNPQHLRENLGAIGWNMDNKDIEKLRKEFPGQKDVSDAVPLI